MNIPKKLGFRPHFGESVVARDRDVEMLIKKINELIDFLQAKEAKNNPIGFYPPEEASKGECSKCGVEYPVHKGDCPELYPPEHEESCCCYSYKHGITPCLCGCHKKD